MAIVDAHGFRFAVSVPQNDEKSLEFATFLHNLRQELLAMSPDTVAALHEGGHSPKVIGIASPLERLGGIAASAAGLRNSGSMEIRPVEN